jgi:methyltransferase-like protein/SAM-dependent methyltransferase
VTEARTTYDEVPYESHPFELTHPDWLATVGALFGMAPPPVETCRVLELGCASGGNLAPMAAALPGATFLGIDLSRRQIEDGRALVAEAGIPNLELRHASILDVDASWGTFDYVICYGVFSWVPRAVQDKILRVFAENLANDGVAYVNYNAHPGGYMMAMLRDMMLFESRRSRDPAERIRHARALLQLLSRWIPDRATHAPFLKDIADKMTRMPDSFIFHEFLEEHNERFYFLDLMRRAEGAGLQFLGEAHVSGMFMHQRAPDEVRAALAEVAPTLKLREQYLDFFRNRTFRQTLLCHAGVALDHHLDAARISRFSFSGRFIPAEAIVELTTIEPARFLLGRNSARVTTSTPLVKAALVTLNEAWPRAIPYAELDRASRARVAAAGGPDEPGVVLADRLWTLFTQGALHMHSGPDRFRVEAGERPRATSYARVQARLGLEVTNLRHERMEVDPLTRSILVQLDGETDRAALLAALRAQGEPDDELESKVETRLRNLGYAAMLLA